MNTMKRVGMDWGPLVVKVATWENFCSLSLDEEEEIREVETRSYELEFDMKKFTYS